MNTLDWLRHAPPGTLVPAAQLADLLEAELDGGPTAAPADPGPPAAIDFTWRERLWLVPAPTRLGTRDVLEALGRSRTWLYGHLGARADTPIPHRKLDGELVFTAGEVRAWLRDHEEVVTAGRMDPESR